MRGLVLGLALCGAMISHARACSGYDIVVLGGQSNGVGRGLEGQWSYPYPEAAMQVFQVVRTYTAGNPITNRPITAAQFAIAQAVEPLDNDTTITLVENPNRIGAAYAFSQYVAAHEPDQTRCVLIVPAARSGTSVLEWNLITRQFAGDLSFFYLDMINRTKLALAALPNSKVVAFLWQQGEQDAETIASTDTPAPLREAGLMPNVATFQTTLTGVMAQFRHDLGCGFPILMGSMSDSYLTNYSTDSGIEAFALATKAAVSTAIQTVAANEPCGQGAYVSGAGLLTNTQEKVINGPHYKAVDLTHYSAAAQAGSGPNTDSMAYRYFTAWQAMTSN